MRAFSGELNHGLERLKNEAAAFEENIRAGMAESDRSLAGLQDQIKADMNDARLQADNELKAAIGRHSLEVEEKIKQSQRELEDWQNKFSLKLRQAEDAVEDARRHSHDLFVDNGERVSRVQEEIEEARAKAVSGISHLQDEITAFRQDAFSGISQLKTEINIARKEALADIAQTREDLKNVREEAEAGKAEIIARAESQLKAFEDSLKNARLRTDADKAELAAEAQAQLKSFEDTIRAARNETEAGKAEILAHAEIQVKALDDAVKEADRRIKEFSAQTNLFKRADELKLQLERSIEDLKGDLKGIDQRRTEAAQIEAQCVTARRIGDEVNAKLTRFLSEKHHLEMLENDFGRLISTSMAVEEKLRAVTSSDDAITGVQVQLRKIADAMTESEERYQRLERKNDMLNETIDGIDRSFRQLEETEAAVRRVEELVEKSQDEFDAFRADISALAAAGEKANNAADKLEALDKNLVLIEKRIEKMQTAREWIAEAQTQLEEINGEIRANIKLVRDVTKGTEGTTGANSRSGASETARENVRRLLRQGWSDEEIASKLKLSKLEVKLIREMELKA
jgi:DNA repair exonuclease SbcCD ATPase subunit